MLAWQKLQGIAVDSTLLISIHHVHQLPMCILLFGLVLLLYQCCSLSLLSFLLSSNHFLKPVDK